MSSFKVAAAAAVMALAPAALAGTCTINNMCPFPVYLTKSVAGTDGPQTELDSNGFSEPITGEAVSLKIMTERGFCMTDNCVQLEYTQDKGMDLLFYDLSNINAQALSGFISHGMTVNNSDPDAQNIICPPHEGRCANTYYQWFENENTYSSTSNADITMHLCSTNGNEIPSGKADAEKEEEKPAPASSHVEASSEAPAPTHAAKAFEAPAAGGPVVEVTVTHTVAGRSEPTPALERRHAHAHVHHNRH